MVIGAGISRGGVPVNTGPFIPGLAGILKGASPGSQTEMSILAYNTKRVMSIAGIGLMEAFRAYDRLLEANCQAHLCFLHSLDSGPTSLGLTVIAPHQHSSSGKRIAICFERMSRMMSRRQFVTSTLAAGVAMASQETTAQPAIRTIVDSQVHLWKAESEDWKWVPGMKPQMREPFTIEKLIPLMNRAGVDRVVVVPPSWPGDRNDYALEAARRYPNRFAVMGRIPLKNPQAAALLPKWREQPGMLGIRLTFLGPAQAWLADGTPDWFWPEAEKADLPVMFLTDGQNAQLARVAERYPRLQLIADHMGIGGNTPKEGRIADAVSQTASLAKYPNVSVKLSAAPNYSSEAYPFPDFTPHIKLLFDAYGPKRCYWGSDMTNGFDKATYRQRITHFTEQLPFLSEQDKDWVMGKSILERLRWA